MFSSQGVLHVWHEPGQDYHCTCIVATDKHGGGSAKGVGEMIFTDNNMNAFDYTKILVDRITPGLQ